MEIQYYETARGDCLVKQFIDDLPFKHQKKIYYRIELFKKLGLQKSLQIKDAKDFKGKKYKGLYELIIDYDKIYYRIFFTMIKKMCWFIDGIKKKSKKTPPQALNKALNIKKQLEKKYGL